MSNKRYYKEQNGDEAWTLWEANCAICGSYVHESYPHEYLNEDVICCDCAFINGLISEDEYIKEACFSDINAEKAAVRDGKIYVAKAEAKWPWEKSNRDCRKSPEYEAWRKAVYERDDYTCQRCGHRGGELNAHHIKAFSKYPRDRFDIDNGVTLCKSCHQAVHKGNGNEWIYP